MMILFGTLFAVLFAMTFFSMFAGFWRMRGMANKVFTLAEQELERKLREGPTTSAATTEAAADPAVCSHCGSRVTVSVTQCPNCGAGLP